MAIPSSALSIFRYSMKRFLLELAEAEGIHVIFDRALTTPDLRDPKVDRWIVPVYGHINTGLTTIEATLYINTCTRQDPEWDKNGQVLDYFRQALERAYSNSGESPIPMYYNNEVVGYITVLFLGVQAGFDFEDQTKVTPMIIRLWSPIPNIEEE